MVKRVIIAASIIFVAGVLGFAATSITNGVSAVKPMFGKQQHLDEKKQFANEGIQKLKIVTDRIDVQVTQADNDIISVRLFGKGNQEGIEAVSFQAEQKGTELVVTIETEDFSFWKQLNANVEVALPAKQYEQLLVRTASGDVEIDQLSVQTADIRTASGDIQAEQIAGQLQQFHTASGDVQGDMLQGDIQAGTSSGDVAFTLAELSHDMKIDTASGDVAVRIQGEPGSLRVEFNSRSGDGKTNTEWAEFTQTEHTMRGLQGKGEHILRVKTESGDFQFYTD